MFQALKNFFGKNGDSKSLAKSRLHFVLVQDRTGLTNEEMNKFKQELVEVIDKYFLIDKEGFDVSYQRENEASTLLINSPVVVKRQKAPKGRIEKRDKNKKNNQNKESAANTTETQPAGNA